jgi:copper transport protein
LTPRNLRLIARTATVFLIATLASMVASSPASAHAYLESTDPVQSSVLLLAPRQVVLTFDEPVEIDFGSLEVLGPSGNRVDEGGTHHLPGQAQTVAISLPAGLAHGTYVVAWRVISADSHPVHGAFVFSIGSAAGASKASSIVSRLAKASGSKVVGSVFWVVRTSAFAGLLYMIGTWTVCFVVWREGMRTTRIRRIVWVSWAVLVVSSFAGIAIQGVYAASLPLTDVLRPHLWDEVVHTRFGELELLRIVLLGAILPLLSTSTRDRPRSYREETASPWAVAAGAALCVALLLVPGLSGHASVGGGAPLGTTLDVLHLASAAVWLGGLAVLAAILLPGAGRADPAMEPVRVARRVSRGAFGAVVVVVTTGVIQSLRQVGSFYALFNTVYGRTLIVKVAFVTLLVGTGAVSRVLVHRAFDRRSAQAHALLPSLAMSTPGAPSAPNLSSTSSAPNLSSAPCGSNDEAGPGAGDAPERFGGLVKSVSSELVLGIAVLCVTALLVNAAPARQAATQPFTQTFSVLGVEVNTIVAPAKVGPDNQFHFYVLGRLGQPVGIPELDASISLPSRQIGPLPIPLVLGGAGHYVANEVDIPFGGSWQLKLTVRTSAIDEQEVFATFPVH